MSTENRSHGVWDGKTGRLQKIYTAAFAVGIAFQHSEQSDSFFGSQRDGVVMLVGQAHRLAIGGLSSDGVVVYVPPVRAEGIGIEPGTQGILPDGLHEPEPEGKHSIKFISGYYCEYDGDYYGDGGGFCGEMANGEVVHDGAAACGPSYEFGTVFEIENYGEVVCKDTGSAISDERIDVFTYYSSGLSAIPQGFKEVVER